MPFDHFTRALDLDVATRITAEALTGADDGELYLEHTAYESLSWADGRLKDASFHIDQGFGLRAVAGEFTAYAHSSALTQAALRQAAATVTAARAGYNGSAALAPAPAGPALYPDQNPTSTVPLEEKIALLQKIDGYIRTAEPRTAQVSIGLASEYKLVSIVRPGAATVNDARPLSRLSVSVTLADGDRREEGGNSVGGREDLAGYLAQWQRIADEALRQARVNMTSVAAPAGEQTVVLAPGFTGGVLLHEAVGHTLEGDFNRKGTSVFSGKTGQQIAARGVTILDDGTLPGRRGSLTVDDEGTPAARNVLIEDGILTGYMQDRQNARLMQAQPTGNGRRESYAHLPMPRMTNTYMANGARDPAEIIGSVKNGIYATSFSGGQVDIVSGRFVFSMNEAYRIEDGRVGAALKGATLIGTGAEAMHRVSMVGNDLRIDDGNCGKSGQSLPVTVGNPTMRLDGMTVGGAG